MVALMDEWKALSKVELRVSWWDLRMVETTAA